MSLTNTWQALGDQNRRQILDLLKKGDKAVAELAVHFKITLPTLSHHLMVLKAANLVTATRQGQQIIYSLNLSVFEEVAAEVYNYFNKSKKLIKKKYD
ncbi:MAG: autorepressor SdpR family transcription factor [Candidatus Buchananbacteria bacterium]